MADQIWAAEWQNATINALEGAHAFWSSIPFHYAFVGHALFCTMSGPEFKNKWLVHLLVSLSPDTAAPAPTTTTTAPTRPQELLLVLQLTFLWGNGGGIVTTALMMVSRE